MVSRLTIPLRSALPKRVQLPEYELEVVARVLRLPINLSAANHDVGNSAALSAALADLEVFFCCRKCKSDKTLRLNYD